MGKYERKMDIKFSEIDLANNRRAKTLEDSDQEISSEAPKARVRQDKPRQAPNNKKSKIRAQLAREAKKEAAKANKKKTRTQTPQRPYWSR
jgi:hypothetical protein